MVLPFIEGKNLTRAKVVQSLVRYAQNEDWIGFFWLYGAVHALHPADLHADAERTAVMQLIGELWDSGVRPGTIEHADGPAIFVPWALNKSSAMQKIDSAIAALGHVPKNDIEGDAICWFDFTE